MIFNFFVFILIFIFTFPKNLLTPKKTTRYSVKAEGGETSATLQPFFTLQLDIQHEMVGSVEEALLQVSEKKKTYFFISPLPAQCQKLKKQ